MTQEFENYKPRKIDFVEIVNANDFTVKVYTITNRLKFESQITLTNCLKLLPDWLKEAKNQQLLHINMHF